MGEADAADGAVKGTTVFLSNGDDWTCRRPGPSTNAGARVASSSVGLEAGDEASRSEGAFHALFVGSGIQPESITRATIVKQDPRGGRKGLRRSSHVTTDVQAPLGTPPASAAASIKSSTSSSGWVTLLFCR